MAQTLVWPDKDPADVNDYSLNWKVAPAATVADPNPLPILDIVAGEVIVSIVHAIVKKPANDLDNPLTIDSELEFDGNQQTKVWLSGGVVGKYEIEAVIITDNIPARVYNRKVKLKVKDL